MKYIFLLLLMIVLASCFNKGDCLITNTDQVQIAFKKKTNGKQDTIFVSSITAQGYPNSPILANSTVQATLSLPIDPTKTYTNFIFTYTRLNQTRQDTLKLSYRPFSRVIATDCGAFLYFTDLNYSKSGFDSIKIVTPQLLKSGPVNVQIFL